MSKNLSDFNYSKAGNAKLAAAFKAGREAMKASGKEHPWEVHNPFARILWSMGSIESACERAFEAGMFREIGEMPNAFAAMATARSNLQLVLRRVR